VNAATRDSLRARVSDSRRTILHTNRLLARIETLKADVKRERSAREKADANARRFHAMLLAERVGRLPVRALSEPTGGEPTSPVAPCSPANADGSLNGQTTRNTNGSRRSTYPGSAAAASQETS
jgi:hypothetical protein